MVRMTAFGSVDSAVEARKQGAYAYLSKPFKMDEGLIVLSRVVEEKRLRRELVSMREELAGRYCFDQHVPVISTSCVPVSQVGCCRGIEGRPFPLVINQRLHRSLVKAKLGQFNKTPDTFGVSG